MSKTAIKKRLDRLSSRVVQSAPDSNTKEIIAAFIELAEAGIISAETLETIHASKGKPNFDPFDCCTTAELRRMAALDDEI